MCGGVAHADAAAEVVYRNGRIYTVDARRPWADAVAVTGGRISGVGTWAEVEPLVRASTRVVDLGGRFVLPGIVDAHTHPSLEAEHTWHFLGRPLGAFIRRHPRVARHLPAWRARRDEALADSLRIMSSYGITAFGEGNTTEEELPYWEDVIREHGLSQHVLMYMRALDASGTASMRRAHDIEAEMTPHALPGVRFGAKIFVDGYLDSQTAAVIHPYLTGERGRGRFNVPPPALRDLVADLDRAGLPIQLHANGDAAVHAALDAVEAARRQRGSGAEPVHAVVHAKLVDDADLPRFARLGVAVVPQPFHAQPSPYSRSLDETVGAKRMEASYVPLQRLWRAGARVAGSSDWASSSMNPFQAMYVGVTRRSPGHPEDGQLGGGNAATIQQMVRAYTIDGAYALNMEAEAGSLEPGKWADLVVLDRNILERPIEELRSTTVWETVFRGEVVYDAARPLPQRLLDEETELLQMGVGH